MVDQLSFQFIREPHISEDNIAESVRTVVAPSFADNERELIEIYIGQLLRSHISLLKLLSAIDDQNTFVIPLALLEKRLVLIPILVPTRLM